MHDACFEGQDLLLGGDLGGGEEEEDQEGRVGES